MPLCVVDLRQSLSPEPRSGRAVRLLSMDYVTVTFNSYYLSHIVTCLPLGKSASTPSSHPTSKRDKCSHSPAGRGSDGARMQGLLGHPLWGHFHDRERLFFVI